MPRTALTVTTLLGPHPGTVAANALDVTMNAGDAVNNNDFTFTGKEVILVQNTHATNPYTFTLQSVADTFHREGDIGPYSLAAGEIAAYWAGDLVGWLQTGNKFWIDVENAAVKVGVLRLPI